MHTVWVSRHYRTLDVIPNEPMHILHFQKAKECALFAKDSKIICTLSVWLWYRP